jgi:putative flippase GtrA
MISSLGSAIRDYFDFLWLNSPKEMWRRIRTQDVPWLIQLSVYGFCGVLATVMSVGIVILLGLYVIPAFDDMIVDGAPITDKLRSRNLLINNTIAFFPTNVFVFYINVLLVFKRGRHHPWMEFLFFTLINFGGFALSQIAGPWLVRQFGIATSIAIFTNAIFAALINFVARKFFVFKG